MAEQTQTTGGACPRLEEVAAFVDGRLGGAERERIVDHLGSCESCYEVFVGTVRFQEEEAGTEGRVARIGGRWKAAAAAAAAAVAAALAAAVMASWLWLPPLPDVEVAGLSLGDVVPRRTGEARARAVGTAEPQWSYLRGGGAGLGSRRTAFRLGVLLVDLEVALRSDEPRRADATLRRLAYEETDELIDVFYAYEQVERGLAAGVERRDLLRMSVQAAATVAQRVRGAAGEELLFALGSWAEAGRLAALAGDADFFTRPEIVGFLAETESGELPEALAVPLARVRELLGGGVPRAELPALAAALGELVEAGGNVSG